MILPQKSNVTITQRIGKAGNVHPINGDFTGNIHQSHGGSDNTSIEIAGGKPIAGKEPTSHIVPLNQIPVLSRIPGTPNTLAENIETYVSLPDTPPDCFAMKVANDAMAPEIINGDYILFVINRRAAVGDIVVVNDEYDEAIIRRLKEKAGESFLVSDNPSYPTFKLTEHFRIMGVVIAGSRQLKF